jgi:sugar phosphate isomerase/epimerase
MPPVEGGPRDAARYRPMLDERGMVYAGSHMALSGNPDVDNIIEYLRVMGSSDVSNSGLIKWGDLTLDDYRESIKLLNDAGRRFREAGVHLHYHNHAFEFDKSTATRTAWTFCWTASTRTRWTSASMWRGCKKAAKIRRNICKSTKIASATCISKISMTRVGASWGSGQVDFAPIMKLLPDMPRVRWVVCEQDETRNEPMDSVAVSRQFLRDTFGY